MVSVESYNHCHYRTSQATSHVILAHVNRGQTELYQASR